MDATKIISIQDQYESGEIGFAAASLALVTEGCSSDDVAIILKINDFNQKTPH